MGKKLVYGVFVVLILAAILIVLRFGPELTTGSVVYKYSCVSPQEATNLIADQDCETFDDPSCTEKNWVAVKCP